MATHSSVLAWRIPGTGEPGGLPSTGSHRVRHNWSDLAAAAMCLLNAVKAAQTSLGFSRQEHWSGLPFPSPMHESEKWRWSRSVVSDSSRLHGLQPTRLLHPWDFPGKSTGVGAIAFSEKAPEWSQNRNRSQTSAKSLGHYLVLIFLRGSVQKVLCSLTPWRTHHIPSWLPNNSMMDSQSRNTPGRQADVHTA